MAQGDNAANDVEAAYREVDGVPIASPEEVWRHERVIEWLMRSHTLLPCRFGTVFPGREELERVLARHKDTLAAALDRVRGHVELGLRVMGSLPQGEPDEERPAVSGRDYLLNRQRRERQRGAAERLADEIELPLGTLCRCQTRRILPAPGVLFTGAYLLPNNQLDPFRRAVQELGSGRRQFRLLCTGPWPPYHFVPNLQSEPTHAGAA